MSLLAPSDVLLEQVEKWEVVPGRYFGTRAMISHLRIAHVAALEALKALVDLDADASANDIRLDVLPADDHMPALLELLRLGIVTCTSGDTAGSVSSWAIAEGVRDTLEAIVKVHHPRLAVAPRLDIPFAKMSIIDMVTAVELQGWRHPMWSPSSRAELPPPIEVASQTPRLWYTHAQPWRKVEETAGRLDPAPP